MSKSGLWLASQEKVNCPIRLFAGVVESGDMHIPHPEKKILDECIIRFFHEREKTLKVERTY